MFGFVPNFGSDQFHILEKSYEIVPAATLIIDADKQTTNNVNYPIPWDAYFHQTIPVWDSGEPDKIFIPYGYKFCQIIAQVGFADNSTGYREIRVLPTFREAGLGLYAPFGWQKTNATGTDELSLTSGYIPLYYMGSEITSGFL